jgi:uncharacterized protein (TIGR03435 family)
MANCLLLCALIHLPGAAFCQASEAEPRFEVASIRLTVLSSNPGRGLHRTDAAIVSESAGRVSYSNATLRALLARAYSVQPSEVIGPEWLDSTHYDIVAKLPPGARKEQIPDMLKNLLTERFEVSAHLEAHEVRGYALLIGKNGVRLTKSKATAASTADTEQVLPISRSLSFTPDGHVEVIGATMEGLARLFAKWMDRPVTNRTELPGEFDITLNMSIQDVVALRGLPAPTGQLTASQPGPPTSAEDTAPENSGLASIFAAVRDLGLKLVPERVDTKRLVVDKASRAPTEN